MKRLLGLGLLLALSSLPALAAKNSKTVRLYEGARLGDGQLQRGICELTWTETSDSQVQLTIRTEDKKTVTVPARVIRRKQAGSAAVVSVENGVRHLKGFRTDDAEFVIIQDAASDLQKAASDK
jgi:hypothetical protein